MICLNWKQRVAMTIGLVLILLSFLFPCWQLHELKEHDRIRDHKYSFLLQPPTIPVTSLLELLEILDGLDESSDTKKYIYQSTSERNEELELYLFWSIDWTRFTFQLIVITLLTIFGSLIFPSPKVISN
ncbi:hypothetical protein KA005_43195 [bacterium]|nr:hypothetical protein [bacterium]